MNFAPNGAPGGETAVDGKTGPIARGVIQAIRLQLHYDQDPRPNEKACFQSAWFAFTPMWFIGGTSNSHHYARVRDEAVRTPRQAALLRREAAWCAH